MPKEILDNILESTDQSSKVSLQCISEVLSFADNSQKHVDKMFHEDFFSDFLQHIKQISFASLESIKINDQDKIVKYNTYNYVTTYVKLIKQLVYPDYYIACFTSFAENSSMWGYYAEGHSGVCLMFSTKPDKNNNPSIKLSLSGEENSFFPYPFHEVIYDGTRPKVNFFENMGNIDQVSLKNFWLNDYSSNTDLYKSLSILQRKSQEQYFEYILKTFKTKMPEWSAEKEFRLMYPSMYPISDRENVENMKYKFEDLAGIIFGLRTNQESRSKIMSIIREKCEKLQREDFDFFEMVHDISRGTFNIKRVPSISL